MPPILFPGLIAALMSSGSGGGGLLIGTLPALPVTPDVVVSTRAELVQAIADAGSTLPLDAKIAISSSVSVLDIGQSNINTGGFTDQTVVVNKPVTIYPQAGYGAYESNPYGDNNRYAWRFQRTVTIKGFIRISAAAAKIYGTAHTVDAWPAASSQTVKVPWETTGIADSSVLIRIEGAANADIQGVECYFGKDNNHAPFDPTEKLADFNSPANWEYTASFEGIVPQGDPLGLGVVFGGHGDASWYYYNRYNGIPIGVSMSGGNPWTGSSFTFANNYMHDLQTGLAINCRGTGVATIDVHHCEFVRQYRDHIIETMEDQTRYESKVSRLIIGSIISDALDSMNPHSDAIQQYMYGGTNSVWVPIAHGRKWAILGFRKNTDRSSLQFMFLQTSAAHYGGTPDSAKNKAYLLGMMLSDLVSLGSNKLFTSDGQRDTLIRRSMGFTADADPINGPASVLFQRGIAAQVGINDIPDSMSLMRDTIFENLSTPNIGASRKLINSAGVGQKGARVSSLATYFTNAAGTQATISDLFALFARQSAHATKGTQAPTLADFLSLPEPDPYEVAFVNKVGVDLNTVSTSNRAYVHGIVGTARTLNIPGGMEARSLDPYTEAEIITWSTGTLAVQSGQLVELRATSANAAVTGLTFNGDLSGVPWEWILQTKSVTPFTKSDFTAARMNKSSNGLTGVTNTRKFSFAMNWTHQSTTVQRILYPGTSLYWSFGLSSQVDFLIRNGAGSNVARIQTNTNTLVVGTTYNLFVSVDLDAEGGTYDDCVKLILNETVPAKGASAAVNPALPHFYFEQAEQWNAFSTNTGSSPFLGDLGMMALWPGVAIDWFDPGQRIKFSSELFGDGSGITGSIPALMFNGVATTLNGSSTANLGSGGAFDNVGTDVVQL